MFPVESVVPKRLVDEAVVAKLFVVVALVEVELSAVKFWRVEEPFTRRLARVPRPLMNVVPKFAAVANIFVELAVVAKRLVVVALVPVAFVKLKLPRIPVPRLKLVEKRLVLDAVVANERVVVALVEVELSAVKFWRVELPFTKRLAIVESPFTNSLPVLKVVAKRLVEDAVVAKKFVLVAFVVVEFPTLRSERVEDENTMIPPPPFGVMSELVEVAHLEFGVVWVAQALFDAETSPAAFAERQPVPVARKRFEVEAVFVKRVVEVALVVVERVAVKKPRVPMPRLKFVPKKLVELAVVAKKLVVVAFVPVAFREKMKSVVEASPLSVTWKSVVEALSVISNTRAPVALVDAKSVKRDDGVEVPIATRVSFNPPAPLELPHTVRTLMSSICAEYD